MKPLALMFLLLLPSSVFADSLRGVAARVIDGDTFDLRDASGQTHRVRLSGIDAPETSQPFGKACRQSLGDQISGKEIVVIWLKADRYKRKLGTALLGSENVNLAQIRSGCAWYFKRYAAETPEIEASQYEAAEAEARKGKVGLWQAEKPIPPWDWRKKKRVI